MNAEWKYRFTNHDDSINYIINVNSNNQAYSLLVQLVQYKSNSSIRYCQTWPTDAAVDT